MNQTIAPATGVSFSLKKNQLLKVIDVEGKQVSDLFCFAMANPLEVLSCARSVDYNDELFLTTGHSLYSNRSNVMLEIVKDTCGRHDLLMPPCSLEMFQIVAGDPHLHHPSCHENLSRSLKSHGLLPDAIQNSFNIFMNVQISETGRVRIENPRSQAGDAIWLLAKMDLIVALTACAHEETNGGKLKQIAYEIHSGGIL